MNGKTHTDDHPHPLYPSLFSPTPDSSQPPLTDQSPPPPPSSSPPSTPPQNTQQTYPPPQPQPQPAYQPQPPVTDQSPPQNAQQTYPLPQPSTSDHHHQDAEASEKWGTHIMGAPAVPTCHPGNQKAATWSAGGGGGGGDDQPQHHHPYLQYSPVEHKPNTSPMEHILNKFNSWGKKAETTAQNIWLNLKTGPSVSGAAWDKVNLTAKAMTGGGFETLFKQTFATLPNEKLKKTFACYLSTTTGPVAGTIYLSNFHCAFCSDRPLSFTAPSRQETWSYYKIMIPLGKICAINPVVMRDNSSEKYLQIVTVDGHDFWFMGFVNYEKATRHLSESLGGYVAPGIPVQLPVAA